MKKTERNFSCSIRYCTRADIDFVWISDGHNQCTRRNENTSEKGFQAEAFTQKHERQYQCYYDAEFIYRHDLRCFPDLQSFVIAKP